MLDINLDTAWETYLDHEGMNKNLYANGSCLIWAIISPFWKGDHI